MSYHLDDSDSQAAEPAERRFVRLGVDVGDARVGIASSDPDGLIATPVETAARDGAPRRVQHHLAQTGAERLYVGLPRSLRGQEGRAAAKARDFVDELVALEPLPGEPEYEVFFVDERFTTVSAHSALSRSGRKTKEHKSVVDQVAAVMILQSALDLERRRGVPAGEPWEPRST